MTIYTFIFQKETNNNNVEEEEKNEIKEKQQ